MRRTTPPARNTARFMVLVLLSGLALVPGGSGSSVAAALAVQDAAGPEVDLSVAWIARLPRIDYVWGSEEPAVEGWPSPGQRVRWVAHVRNLSGQRIPAVGYRWTLDGRVVEAGTRSVRPRGTTRFRFPWAWEFQRHELAFEIDPDDDLEETEERNNRLLVHTDAIGVGFWVERSYWEDMREELARVQIGANTFDDLMQLRIRQFNEMAALARYPETRDGVLDRWRIDAIHRVSDGALPISPLGPEVRDWGASPAGYPTLYPDTEDRSIDMEWGFPASSSYRRESDVSWLLLNSALNHELGHARYLVDVYAWDLDDSQDVVEIDPGPPTTGWGQYHEAGEYGMMNKSWGFIDRYSAVAMNLIAGHRATRGHYNEPTNIGSFLNDLPAQNRLRIVTPDGAVFPRSRVRIYRASGQRDPDWRDHPYRLFFDDEPDVELETDGNGTVLVGRNPFSDGPVVIEVDRNNALAIVEVVDDAGDSHWGYLESRVFNLAFWHGDVALAEHELLVDAPVCSGLGLGSHLVTPDHRALVSSSEVTFSWPALANGGRFTLLYSVDGGRPQRMKVPDGAPGTRVSATVDIDGDHVAWWYAYEDPVWPEGCPEHRSSIYFFDIADDR